MKIYVARHGVTQWNLDNRISGRTDIPMIEEGIRQAKKLAEEVAPLGVDLMLVSPLQRTRQTAEIISKRCGIPWEVDERLIEHNFGTFEGKQRTDPEFQRIRRNFSCRYPGGESPFDVAARVYPLLDEVRTKYADKTVLLIGHGALVRVIRTYFVDMTTDEFCNYITDNCKCVLYEVPPLAGVIKEEKALGEETNEEL